QPRNVRQPRRPDSLAGEDIPAARLRDADLSGPLRDHQAHRHAHRAPAGRRALRKTAAMIPLEWMAPLMFGALVVFMLIGYPVAFSLAAVGLAFGFYAIEAGQYNFQFSLLQALPLRVFGIMSNELLLSIPFFTFMGAVLERCGLAEDLLEGM